MVTASFPWTCGHWVGCGPCVVSWPQPAATGWGSGSHPSQCVVPGLLWWRSSFLGGWYCCLAVFLWLQVWQAYLLFHFPEDHSGLGPTAGLFIFGSNSGKLVRFFISWKTAVGWYPLHDYSFVLCDLMKAFSETKEFASCCRLQDWKLSATDRRTTCWHSLLESDHGGGLYKSLNLCHIVGAVLLWWLHITIIFILVK